MTFEYFFYASLVVLFRKFIIKRKLWMIITYSILFLGLGFFIIGGSSVCADAETRYAKFKIIEDSNFDQKIIDKYLAEPDGTMLKIDLEAFKSSLEFEAYLDDNEKQVTRFYNIWLVVCSAIIIDILLALISYIYRYFKRK